MSEALDRLLEGMTPNAQQWRVLETDFACGLSFLQTWATWRTRAQRPRMLHFVALLSQVPTQAELQQALPTRGPLQPLGEQLAAQWWGLLPGIHRLSFEQGQVLLTLYVGDTQNMLRRQPPLAADGICMSNAGDDCWSQDALKNLARHCRRGTLLAAPASSIANIAPALRKLGFELEKSSAQTTALQARYNPAWEPRHRSDGLPAPVDQPGHCLVLGAGLAGAAAAASLARRGWQVSVLDKAAQPAAGASGLPAGLFCPHISPDDSVLSRLSRSGVRTTLQTLQQVSGHAKLQTGRDWAPVGVLEHDLNEPAHLPPQWMDAGNVEEHSTGLSMGLQWSSPASPEHLAAAHLPPGSHAIWHAQAGWVRPAQLVRAMLQSPGIQWQGNAHAAKLQRDSTNDQWQVLDDQGQVLAQAPILVLALGPDSKPLLQAIGLPAGEWELQAIRGQVSLAEHDAKTQAAMPPFPVNGHGNLVPDFPGAAPADAHQWIMGSTFERDVTELPPMPADQQAAHASNGEKLAALLPACRQALQSFFDAPQQPATWARVRCAAYDRLPLTGPVGQSAEDLPGLWVLTGLGSRGLTLSMLCGELLAARLHGEPLPLDAKLAQALGTQRLWSRSAASAQ